MMVFDEGVWAAAGLGASTSTDRPSTARPAPSMMLERMGFRMNETGRALREEEERDSADSLFPSVYTYTNSAWNRTQPPVSSLRIREKAGNTKCQS